MTDATALYDKLITTHEKIERKGKTMPYTSLNGHMFSFISKEGIMGLRLSEAERVLFMEEHKASIMMQHGRVMKEYVEVPTKLLNDTVLLSKYLELSYEYITTLKPKPTKKK